MYFDPGKETVVQVDASRRGRGSSFVQEGEVVASRALTDTEKRYAKLSATCLPLLLPVRGFTLIYLLRGLWLSQIINPLR